MIGSVVDLQRHTCGSGCEGRDLIAESVIRVRAAKPNYRGIDIVGVEATEGKIGGIIKRLRPLFRNGRNRIKNSLVRHFAPSPHYATTPTPARLINHDVCEISAHNRASVFGTCCKWA